MLGILILITVYIWFLMGDRFNLSIKFIICAAAVYSYVYYLQAQGANRDQIIEILLTFPG